MTVLPPPNGGRRGRSFEPAQGSCPVSSLPSGEGVHEPPSSLRTARWIELEDLTPQALHAAYVGLAESQHAEAAPIVLWARCTRPHLSLSETRSPSLELDLDACRRHGIEVIARPLGGGAVLVDGAQQVLFFILPLAGGTPPPRVFIRRSLEPLVQTYRRFGIAAEVSGGTDVVIDGAKLSGSGAATLGPCLVFGSSFVQRFDHDLFCRLLRVPSEGFRRWLREALEEGFRPWPARLAAWPGAEALRAALRSEIAASLGWRCEDDEPCAAERAAMTRAEQALPDPSAEDEGRGRRHIPGGVKINAGMYLTESSDGRGWLRVLTRHGRLGRIAAEDETVSRRLQSCLGLPPLAAVLAGRLASTFARGSEAEYWACRIEATAATGEG